MILKKGDYLQQGDVLIFAKDEKVKGKKLKHLTLAEGEATGHHHTIYSGVACLLASEDAMNLKVESETALLKHQEHKEFDIPQGDYEIRIVREYDHFEEEVREVRD